MSCKNKLGEITAKSTHTALTSAKVDPVGIQSQDLKSRDLKFNRDFLVQRYMCDKINTKITSVFLEI